MPTTLTLRYPTACAECGAALAPGTTARYYGRGRAYGLECHADSRKVSLRRETPPAPARQNVTCAPESHEDGHVALEPCPEPAPMTLAQVLAYGTGVAGKNRYGRSLLVKDKAACNAVRLAACKNLKFGFALATNHSLSLTRDADMIREELSVRDMTPPVARHTHTPLCTVSNCRQAWLNHRTPGPRNKAGGLNFSMALKGLNVTVDIGCPGHPFHDFGGMANTCRRCFQPRLRYDVKCSICGKVQLCAASHPALYCGDCLRPYVERGKAWEQDQWDSNNLAIAAA